MHARAVQGEYNPNRPDMQYVNAVQEAFPEEGVASCEEAMVRACSV